MIRDSQNENKVEQTDKLHIRPQYPKSIENESPAGASLPTATLVPLFNNLVNNGSSNNNNDGPYVKILVRLYLSYSGDKPATQVKKCFLSKKIACVFLYQVPELVFVCNVEELHIRHYIAISFLFFAIFFLQI